MLHEGSYGHIELVTPEQLTDAQVAALAGAADEFECIVKRRVRGESGIRLIVRTGGGLEAVAERLRQLDGLLGCEFDEAAVVGVEPDEVAFEWQKIWINRF